MADNGIEAWTRQSKSAPATHDTQNSGAIAVGLVGLLELKESGQ
jgi:hypothetical protein